MRREILSIEDHQKVVAELSGIDAAISRVFKLCNRKVPAAILDQLCTFHTLDRSLFKLKDSLDREAGRRHQLQDSLYF